MSDELIMRADLPKRLGRSSETIRRMLKANKIPAPDVDLSQKTRGWWASTLARAGINLQGQEEATATTP